MKSTSSPFNNVEVFFKLWDRAAGASSHGKMWKYQTWNIRRQISRQRMGGVMDRPIENVPMSFSWSGLRIIPMDHHPTSSLVLEHWPRKCHIQSPSLKEKKKKNTPHWVLATNSPLGSLHKEVKIPSRSVRVRTLWKFSWRQPKYEGMILTWIFCILVRLCVCPVCMNPPQVRSSGDVSLSVWKCAFGALKITNSLTLQAGKSTQRVKLPTSSLFS